MQLFTSLDSTTADGAWLTIGSFDGVHRGHQEIVRRLVAGAHANAAPAVVLTFFPHPAVVLRGVNGPFYLTSPNERAFLLGNLGVDMVIVEIFNQQLADTSARDFVIKLKKCLGIKRLLVGHDFTLGRRREGNIAALEQLGNELNFILEVTSPVMDNGKVISSSQVRTALLVGNITLVHELLGRPYSVTGEVVPGDGRGRLIGIPTANLKIWPEQLLPSTGVYVSKVYLGDKIYGAITNIGVRPTFDSPTPILWVETHILDFRGNLYGQKIRINFFARLRSERKFPNIQELLAQINDDVILARQMLEAVLD